MRAIRSLVRPVRIISWRNSEVFMRQPTSFGVSISEDHVGSFVEVAAAMPSSRSAMPSTTSSRMCVKATAGSHLSARSELARHRVECWRFRKAHRHQDTFRQHEACGRPISKVRLRRQKSMARSDTGLPFPLEAGSLSRFRRDPLSSVRAGRTPVRRRTVPLRSDRAGQSKWRLQGNRCWHDW